jgi:hypothetical protein
MIGCTYADDRMTYSAELCRLSMIRHGCINATIRRGLNDPPTRGAGYWQWMPRLVVTRIKQALEKGEDFVIYCDAGVEVINSLRYITDRMTPSDHVWLFGNEHSHERWCKADVLEAMDWRGSINDRQVQASVHVWRASGQALEIAQEWKQWCEDMHMIDDSPSEKPEHAHFIEHRHPQAVLTNIAYAHGIPLHWWPSEYGRHIKHLYPNDTYPQLFNHHRKRNPSVVEANQPVWDEHEYTKRINTYV